MLRDMLETEIWKWFLTCQLCHWSYFLLLYSISHPQYVLIFQTNPGLDMEIYDSYSHTNAELFLFQEIFSHHLYQVKMSRDGSTGVSVWPAQCDNWYEALSQLSHCDIHTWRLWHCILMTIKTLWHLHDTMTATTRTMVISTNDWQIHMVTGTGREYSKNELPMSY